MGSDDANASLPLRENQVISSLLKKPTKKTQGISLFSATALGIGGMMGAGLFSLLGAASLHAGTHIPLAFLVGAIAASFSVYSYAKLGATFPSSGGAATFTVMSFGPGIISGGINIFQFIAYLIAAALYAAGFSEYANTMMGGNLSPLEIKIISCSIVVLCAGINLLGTDIVGRAEILAIGFVVIALILFSVGGIHAANTISFSMSGGSIDGIAIATGILYINYQGFAVVTDARRREVYAATYDGAGIRLTGPDVLPARELSAATREAPVFGIGGSLYSDEFADVRTPEYVSASWLGRLAAQHPDRTTDTTPMYLRRPDAVENASRKRVTPA
jgi:hypothetical protein